MTVNVASSGQAYVGMYDPGEPHPPTWADEYHNGSADANGEVPLLALRNQFNDADIDVIVSVDDMSASDVELNRNRIQLDTGDTKLITAEVHCTGHDEQPVEVDISATNTKQSLHAEIEYTVRVPCSEERGGRA
jgi:hypothetical protein